MTVPKKVKLNDLETIGLKVRKARELSKLSRSQLAFELGTTEKQLTRIEYGEINTGVMSLVKLSRALNVPLITFFKGLK